MTLLDEIQKRLRQLPPDKQSEVLDFIAFLQHKQASQLQPGTARPLREHPAFGLWRKRNIDALAYQQTLRAEWDR